MRRQMRIWSHYSQCGIGFKSRVALFEGTRQKFFGYGHYQTHLQVALERAITHFQRHVMACTPTRRIRTAVTTTCSNIPAKGRQPENILVRIYGENEINDISSNNYTLRYSTRGAYATGQYRCDYLYKDDYPKTNLLLPDADRYLYGI